MDEMLARILECMGTSHGAGKELADHLGISPNVITNWKNGSNRSYRKHLPRIAEFYHVTVAYLEGREASAAAPAPVPATDAELKFALFGGTPVTDAQYEEVKRFAKYIAEKGIHSS